MTFQLPHRVAEGRRNDQLVRFGGLLRRHGLTEPQIASELLEANASRCVPPLDSREVRAIARSVSRYPIAGPLVTWGHPPRDMTEVARRRGFRLVGSVTRITKSQFTVGGRRGGGPFHVDLGGSSGPTCTCTWFSNSGNATKTCSHIEACKAWVRLRYRPLEVAGHDAV